MIKVIIVTDVFLEQKELDYTLFPRGSAIQIYTLLTHIARSNLFSIRVIQMGTENKCCQYKGIPVTIIKAGSIEEFSVSIHSFIGGADMVHYSNIDLFFPGKIKVPLMATIHTNTFLENEKAAQWLLNHMNYFTKLVAVNIQYLQNFDSQLFKLIRNGIDTDVFVSKQNRKIENLNKVKLFFPNVIEPVKNFQFAFELIRYLNRKKHDRFQLIVASDNYLNLHDDCIVYIGKQDYGKKMVQLYQSCDFTIICSNAESCSLCALESMAVGTVVLGNNIQGMNEYVENGRTGFLIDTYGEEVYNKWYEVINMLIDNPAIYQNIADNAIDIIQRYYNADLMAREYIELWKIQTES